jgi:hypothetical protein
MIKCKISKFPGEYLLEKNKFLVILFIDILISFNAKLLLVK